MNTSTQIELAAPALNQVARVEATPKAELVFSKEVKISQIQTNLWTVAGGGFGALLGFGFGGNSFDLIPLMSVLAVGSGGFMHTLMRYLEVDEESSAGLKGVKLRHSAVSLFRKEKRIPLVTFGVYDPENTCMKYWVNSNRSCEKDRATHVVTHYLVKKGFKVYREQEVVQSLEALWDSSLDAVEEHYATHRIRYM